MLMAMSGVEMGEEGGLVFLALTALLLSVISKRFRKNQSSNFMRMLLTGDGS